MSTISLSLRDARRWDQEIDVLIKRLRNQIKLIETVSVYHVPFTNSGIKTKESAILADLKDVVDLSNFRFALRGEVQAANQAQINTLTLRLAQKEAAIGLIEGLTVTEEEDSYLYRRKKAKKLTDVVDAINVDEVNSQLSGMKHAVENGSAVTTYDLKLMTRTLTTVLNKLVSDYKREINKIKDQLIQANNAVQIKIDVDDNVNTLLKEHGLTFG